MPSLSSLRRNAIVLVLTGVAAASGVYLAIGTKPWHTGVAAAVAEKKVPAVWDSMLWGWWWAAWAVLFITLGLVLTRCWWAGSPVVRVPVPKLGERPLGRRVWWGLLAVLMVATGIDRWPRMNHSLWGDESMAVLEYVQGHYIKARADDPQGPLKFRRVTWKETVFGDRQMGNNHYLFSQLSRLSVERWRRWRKGERHEFSEAAIRLPAFAGGLALLAALAGVGWRLGAPRAGLLAAVLMALHPWHVRYCTEARGYSLMGLFFCLALMLLITALESGAWWAWAMFATSQFLALYSCKIAVYPLALLNVFVAIALWRCGGGSVAERFRGLGRWLVVNAVSAVVFLVLYAPCHAQAVAAVEKIRGRGLNDLSFEWVRDMASEALTGIPWRTLTPDNPVQVTWSKIWRGAEGMGGVSGQCLGALGFAGILAAVAFGGARLWRRCRPAAWAGLAVLISAVASMLHFHEVLKVELLPWYWFFLTPVLCLAAAFGAMAAGGRACGLVAVGLVAAFGLATAPLSRRMTGIPFEDFRSAVAASRGRHEDPNQRARSRIHTCWLWRSSLLYDPRADTRLRTLPMLNQRIRAARRAGGELYVIIGYPSLSARLTPTVYERVTTSPQFEKVADFPAQVPRHTLTVYRYVPEAGEAAAGSAGETGEAPAEDEAASPER